MKRVIELSVLRPGSGYAEDTVINEVPVALQYNGISHAVMLCTPGDLEDFALGFSLSEGILYYPKQLFDIGITESALGITVEMEIASEAFAQLKNNRRSMTGRTGCGICGVDNLMQVSKQIDPVVREFRFSIEALYHGVESLSGQQKLQKLTGAVHAACHVSQDGTLSHIREDVGRHNALDKSLGALARARPSETGALLVTSRASIEMVQKTAALGFGILAAVSAPTAAAIDLANRLNISLIGFLRDRRCVIYTHETYISDIQRN